MISGTCLGVPENPLLFGPADSKHSAGPEPATHSTTSRQLQLYFQAKRHQRTHMTFPKKALRPQTTLILYMT